MGWDVRVGTYSDCLAEVLVSLRGTQTCMQILVNCTAASANTTAIFLPAVVNPSIEALFGFTTPGSLDVKGPSNWV